MFVRTAWLVLRKDLTVEVRSLEIAYTTLFFAVSCVLVFAFALVKEGKAPEDGAAGILWIAIAFAGTLALGRAFERERQSETLRALLLAPADRPAIYVGKLLGIIALLRGGGDRAGAARGVPVPGAAPVASVLAERRARQRHDRLRGGGDAVRRDAGARAQPRRAAAGAVVSDHGSGHHCRRPRHRGAAAARRRAALVRFWVALLLALDVVFVTLALWTFEPLMTD